MISGMDMGVVSVVAMLGFPRYPCSVVGKRPYFISWLWRKWVYKLMIPCAWHTGWLNVLGISTPLAMIMLAMIMICPFPA